MRRILFSILSVMICSVGFAQVTCSATSDSGSGYPAFIASGLGIENPDCVHGGFGAHITQVLDTDLQKNVFLFHSHIDDDNDRCQVFDRVRMEVKGGPGSDLELQHPLNATSYYRWKFRISQQYTSSGSFHHIFQLKAKGGQDDSFPVLTITLRSNTLEFRHDGGDTGVDLGVLQDADLERFRGKWVEAFIRVVHKEDGEVEFSLKDLLNGNVLLQYQNNNIDLWRTGADYNRPKWGMYRLKNSSLEDESFRFADFCVSETEVALCPADTTRWQDIVAPTIPQNLQASNIMISSVDLDWEKSTDAFGVVAYRVYQDGNEIWEGPETGLNVINLVGSTQYSFSVAALDEAGNLSAQSEVLTITTDDANALPGLPSNPFPADGSEVLQTDISLRWTNGENTDSTFLYLGTSPTPQLIAKLDQDFFDLTLDAGVQYYWQIVHKNENGETVGPIWTFSTSDGNVDDPWLVYRANERLDIETNFFLPLDIPSNPTLDQVRDDPNGSTNQFYDYYHEEAEKFRWRYELNPNDTAITVVARIKALSEAINCMCYFEVKAFGWREKLRINQSTVKLERSSPEVEENIPFAFKDQFHLIRVTMKQNIMKVYLDENPTPIAIGNSIDDDTSQRFEWGKSGSNPCGSSIDWMAILPNEANAPAEGPDLPADLFLSSDATLAELQIDGSSLPGFNPNTFTYFVDLGSSTDIPTLTYTTSSPLAQDTIVNPTSVPNTAATIGVTAQDGFTQNVYTINYTSSTTSINNLAEAGITVFPNPASEYIMMTSKLDNLHSIKIYNLLGILVYQNNGSQKRIYTKDWPAGEYVMQLEMDTGQRLYHKILIER